MAARNILVGDNKTLKISDFGLSRSGEIYVKLGHGKIPLRWMSIEAIKDQIYTRESDVYVKISFLQSTLDTWLWTFDYGLWPLTVEHYISLRRIFMTDTYHLLPYHFLSMGHKVIWFNGKLTKVTPGNKNFVDLKRQIRQIKRPVIAIATAETSSLKNFYRDCTCGLK